MKALEIRRWKEKLWFKEGIRMDALCFAMLEI